MRAITVSLGIFIGGGGAIVLLSGAGSGLAYGLVIVVGMIVGIGLCTACRPLSYDEFQRRTLPETPAQLSGASANPSTRSGFVGGGISTPRSGSNPNRP